ncbi:MAG: DUF2029 domain-containing protein [Actinobacteria bacterium]|nr:MAG: DUF2029 domain-containing protein [Actinomycetota bacterium]
MAWLALLVGTSLLALTALVLAHAMSRGSATGLLIAAYVIGWTELVCVTLGLSAVHAVTRGALLATLGCAAGVALFARRRSLSADAVSSSSQTQLAALRRALGDRILLSLATAVAAGVAYAVALTVVTPQNDDDVIFDHLLRAALWRQSHAVGHPFCACAPYIQTYPPHGEIGSLFAMVLGPGDRFVGLVQTVAYLVTTVGVVGLARRIGLSPREAVFGGLVFATLPIVVLQASTAQNDLLVASFLVAAVFFLLDASPKAPWLAGAATALAVGTKVTAPLALPLLSAIAIMIAATHRMQRLLALVGGTALGAYWYVSNALHYGAWNFGFPEGAAGGPADVAARWLRLGIEFIDLAGARGRDIWLYPLAAVLIAVILVASSAAGRTRRPSVALSAALLLVGSSPLLLRPLARASVHAYASLWLRLDRPDLANLDTGRDITYAASNFSWYGPLGLLLLLALPFLAVGVVRRRRIGTTAALMAIAPLYWLIAVSLTVKYQEWDGRFFMFPMALAASTLGLLWRFRTLTLALTGIAVTALALVLVNDGKRPAGLPLLEPGPRHHPLSRPAGSEQGSGRARSHPTRCRLPVFRPLALSSGGPPSPRNTRRASSQLGVRRAGLG